jgi:hypothetical protein
MVIMVAPEMIPGFPVPGPGIKYSLRCEAVTACEIGAVDFQTFIEISLGIASNDFKRMATKFLVRWDLAQLRCSNFMAAHWWNGSRWHYSNWPRISRSTIHVAPTHGINPA